LTTIWYQVHDLDGARRFYTGKLGFDEIYHDADGGWVKLQRGVTEIGLAKGSPEQGGVAHVDVEDVKGEAERLRAEGVEVGVVLELHGEMRLLDVYDPDGNRIQLAQDIAAT
jgi:catechol 2,3-dioxygenase-like lactoylglutathione lyase family enzyme